ncbi:MAG: WecB/TagA/CpsF family glycosyltransferase, partial [Polyangiaceae bacterium]
REPDLVLVGFGAPKQELWMHESADDLRPSVLFGIGATLDFLAGTAKRAPRWMSRVGLEWLHRLAQEPGRMSRRYLLRDPKFLGIVASDLIDRRLVSRAPGGPP